MKRRAFLTTAAGALAASAGCIGSAVSGDSPDETVVDDDGGDGDTFGDVGCPSFAEDADYRTNCYRTVDTDEAAVYLEPSTPTFEEYAADDTVETIRFTLHNQSDSKFHLDPYTWRVYRHGDGDWTKVTPDKSSTAMGWVEAGDSIAWSLATQSHPSPQDGDEGDGDGSDGGSEGARYDVTADLESGHTHAFRIDGRLWTDDRPMIECIAVFDYLKAVP